MKLYERLENNNFDEIDRNRAIELIEGGNGHLVYNENYFKLQKVNKKYKQFFDLMLKIDSDYFMNCGDEETNKLVDEILKLESEE